MNKTTIQQFLDEVIMYGGLPLRRCDAYQDALQATGSEKAADMFAFRYDKQPVPAGTIPLTLDEFQNICRRERESAPL